MTAQAPRSTARHGPQARRRAVRAERLAVILARISPADQAALAAALPAIDALTAAPYTDETTRPKEST